MRRFITYLGIGLLLALCIHASIAGYTRWWWYVLVVIAIGMINNHIFFVFATGTSKPYYTVWLKPASPTMHNLLFKKISNCHGDVIEGGENDYGTQFVIIRMPRKYLQTIQLESIVSAVEEYTPVIQEGFDNCNFVVATFFSDSERKVVAQELKTYDVVYRFQKGRELLVDLRIDHGKPTIVELIATSPGLKKITCTAGMEARGLWS